MYVPKHFRPREAEAVDAVLADARFATLVTSHNGTPMATHLPVEYRVGPDGQADVLTHMARANPQWREAADGDALLIVQGPHAYISPSFYRDTEVPTWNYVAVHLYGALSVVDEDALASLLERQIVRNESPRACPVMPGDYSAQFLRQSQRGAVGLRLAISRFDASFKLSQNRPEQAAISEAFASSKDAGERALAPWMQ